MPTPPPSVDPRSDAEIAAQLEQWAQAFTDWRPDGDRPDAGRAMLRIFGRMASQVRDRLNQVPDKNFLAFLNLIGTDLLPPQPARVPLTFYLATGATQAVTVPAGTQVAALPLAGETEEVVFETEQDLLVTPVNLQALIVQDPDRDRYSDHSAQLQPDNPVPFAAFRGERPIAHRLYLACDDLFTQPGPKALTLRLRSSEVALLAALPLTWSYWDGEQWQTVLGVIDGFNLQIDVNQAQVTVQPGTAIDAAGNRIPLLSPQTLALAPFFPTDATAPAIVVLLLAHNAITPQVPILRVVRQTELGTAYPATTHLRLALLELAANGSIRRTLPTGEIPPLSNWALAWPAAPAFAKTTVDGVEAAWLRVQLYDTPLPPGQTLPKLGVITAQINLNRPGLAPDRAFFNNAPLDLSKDFYPLGEQPRFNDTLYLASREVFSRSGQSFQVAVNITRRETPTTVTPQSGQSTPVTPQVNPQASAAPAVDPNKAQLAWEIWQGSQWEPLVPQANPPDVAILTQSGVVTLALPGTIAPTTIAGESNYWIRARLIQGNYGEAAKTVKTGTTPEGFPIYELVAATYKPPSLKTLTLTYTLTQSRTVDLLRTENDFLFHNPLRRLPAIAIPGKSQLNLGDVQGIQTDDRLLLNPEGPNLEVVEVASVNPLDQSVTLKAPLQLNHLPGTLVLQFFPLFAATEDTESAFYLGCDRPFPNQVNTLYLQPATPEAGVIAQNPPPPTPAHIVWEYSSLAGWRNLGAVDTTQQFSEPGLLQFIGPVDFAPRSRFGRTLYWFRARWERGRFRVLPRLQRVLTNTIWASQTTTFRQINLGGSNGHPNLHVQTPHTPVLPGEILMVNEAATAATSHWVTWQGVPDFYRSGPTDRHYTCDRQTGLITFGDGQRGRVPPVGLNNIRITYGTGGGRVGNCAAQTLSELKTTIPYVDRVLNWEAAGGGADAESLNWARERGPKQLRHRGRAVTAADFADLTYEASPAVARVQVITPSFRSLGLQWQPVLHLEITTSGEIWVQLRLNDADATTTVIAEETLTIQLTGPGQQHPYASQTGTGDLELRHTVTPAQIALGSDWQVTIANWHPMTVRRYLTLAYPGSGRTQQAVDIPAHQANQLDTAGQVEVILVPNHPHRQPTPSLALLDRVETYLRDRAVPTLSLSVTEPDWAEVTVSVTVVPRHLTHLDRLHQEVNDALTYFLHPLTGGPDGQGWAFGRHPHASDLYRVLEAIPNVDHVQQLDIAIATPLDSSPIHPLAAVETRRDRLLIYSGLHQITIAVDST